MPQTKTAAPVLQHRDGQTKNIITCILPHLARVCKVCANFALLGCGLGALCAVAALAQGGGAASLAGLAACLLGVGCWAVAGRALVRWLGTGARQRLFQRALALLLVASVLGMLA